MKRNKGFTIVELLVTIAVIAILVLLTAPRLLGYTDKAKVTELTVNTREIETASERYYMDHDDWPRLTDEPYTKEEVNQFAENIYDITGKEASLDPDGKYYNIDFDKLKPYIDVPGDKINYILQNPVGKVYSLYKTTQKGYDRINYKPLRISVNPIFISTESNVQFGYEYDKEETSVEWDLNGNVSSNPPNGKLQEGVHIIKVRVLDSSGEWTKWFSRKIEVKPYIEHLMNNPGSEVTNEPEYEIGDNLVFSYTNSNNLNWTTKKTGDYQVVVVAPGAGGAGARVEGKVSLTEGDLINLKIHSSGNGGGAGGAGGHSSSSSGQSRGNAGRSGSAGALFSINEELIIAAGGAGGSGANGVPGGRPPFAYPGSGGAGGDGGVELGLPGKNGSNSKGNSNRSGGLGGKLTAQAGGPGLGSNNGKIGQNGTTEFDGGGGGGSGSGTQYYPSAGGGGGAGGRSFVQTEKVNDYIITSGYNRSHGKVIITYLGE